MKTRIPETKARHAIPCSHSTIVARLITLLRSLVAVLLATTLGFLAGCGNSASNTTQTTVATKKGRDSFVYARTAAVTSLNLWTQITANNAFAIDKIFESLLTFTQDGQIIDHLTKSHKVSGDGLTYTFTLRDDVKFSSGRALSAQDVVFSLNQHLNHEDAAISLDAPIETIQASGDTTVIITLTQPYAPFLSELAGFSNGVVPDGFDGKSEDEFFENPIGTGPFVIQQWDKAGDITFRVNEYYWSDKPTFSTLVYKLIDDDTQAINQLRSGQVDAVEDAVYENLEDLENNDDISVLTDGSWKVEQVFFNTLNEHFADVHVRRAIAMAFDKQALTKAVVYGYGDVLNTIVPETLQFSANKTVTPLTYDIEAAKAELQQSNYPDGFDTTILVPSSKSSRVRAAQIIQAALAQIGITVSIDQTDMATFRSRFFEYDYDMMINTGQADYPDADSLISFQADPTGFSKCFWTNYNNPEVAELVQQAKLATSDQERSDLYVSIQQTLVDEAPYIPLYSPDSVKVVRSDIAGMQVLPNGSVRLNTVSFK